MKPWTLRCIILSVEVVPYIGTWIETGAFSQSPILGIVVPYIGTWIETDIERLARQGIPVVPYIGTWIETYQKHKKAQRTKRRTLYRYVD